MTTARSSSRATCHASGLAFRSISCPATACSICLPAATTRSLSSSTISTCLTPPPSSGRKAGALAPQACVTNCSGHVGHAARAAPQSRSGAGGVRAVGVWRLPGRRGARGSVQIRHPCVRVRVAPLTAAGLSKWTAIVAANPPAARCNHTMNAVGDKLYVFGGRANENTVFNDVHVFDTGLASHAARGDDVMQRATRGRRPLCAATCPRRATSTRQCCWATRRFRAHARGPHSRCRRCWCLAARTTSRPRTYTSTSMTSTCSTRVRRGDHAHVTPTAHRDVHMEPADSGRHAAARALDAPHLFAGRQQGARRPIAALTAADVRVCGNGRERLRRPASADDGCAAPAPHRPSPRPDMPVADAPTPTARAVPRKTPSTGTVPTAAPPVAAPAAAAATAAAAPVRKAPAVEAEPMMVKPEPGAGKRRRRVHSRTCRSGHQARGSGQDGRRDAGAEPQVRPADRRAGAAQSGVAGQGGAGARAGPGRQEGRGGGHCRRALQAAAG